MTLSMTCKKKKEETKTNPVDDLFDGDVRCLTLERHFLFFYLGTEPTEGRPRGVGPRLRALRPAVPALRRLLRRRRAGVVGVGQRRRAGGPRRETHLLPRGRHHLRHRARHSGPIW